MPRYSITYCFIDEFTGDADFIAKSVRDLSFSPTFNPRDLTAWNVNIDDLGNFILFAKRTVKDEIFETSKRAAVRKFLYGMDLPDDLDVSKLEVEELDVATSLQDPRDARLETLIAEADECMPQPY
jgi:hypothetical protein